MGSNSVSLITFIACQLLSSCWLHFTGAEMHSKESSLIIQTLFTWKIHLLLYIFFPLLFYAFQTWCILKVSLHLQGLVTWWWVVALFWSLWELTANTSAACHAVMPHHRHTNICLEVFLFVVTVLTGLYLFITPAGLMDWTGTCALK